MPKEYKSSFTPNGEEEPLSKVCLGCKEDLSIKKFKSARNQKRTIDGVEVIGTVRNAKCLDCESNKPSEEREEIVYKSDLKSVCSYFTEQIEALTRKVDALERILADKKTTELPPWLK